MRLLLIFCLSTALAMPCDKSSVTFSLWDQVGLWFVTYDEHPCDSDHMALYFCEDSGWGTEEATAVCREQGYLHGIGRYILVMTPVKGYSHISCQGTEATLEECDIGNVSESCNFVAVVDQCSNLVQVYVTGMVYGRVLQYHRTITEFESSTQLCFVTNGMLEEHLFIDVETAPSTNNSAYISAIAGYDYHPLRQTLTFEPLDMTRSRQCLQIEIVNDSLAEETEVFSVLLSTNSTTVSLLQNQLDLYIYRNDGSCVNGSVTVVSDVDNSSLQLVEMCSSKRVWSPVCDYDWTLQDATVVCKELGYRGMTGPPVYAVVDSGGRHIQSGNVAYECLGSESRLVDCVVPLAATETPCYYALVQCNNTDTMMSDSGDGNSRDGNSVGGIVAGVVVGLVLLVVTSIVVAALLLWMKRKMNSNGLQNARETGDEGNDEKPRLSLANPTYQLTTIPQPSNTRTPEHKFFNPLYNRVGMSEPSGNHQAMPADNSTADYEHMN